MEISEENREILIKAINHFGNENQIEMLKEELCELLMELLRLNRNRTTEAKIIEEIADVQIMIWQAAILFGDNEKMINEIIHEKMERLKNRIS